VKRIVQPEILDTLPPDDPRAVHSRHDLRRINGWMRSHANMALALKKNWNEPAPRRIIELGAGDGQFLLAVAQKISPGWPDVSATLLDRQANVSAKTLKSLAAFGWRADVFITDVFDWPPTDSDIVIANLFLHHFEDAWLLELLRLISQRACLFIALEPRRSPWPLLCSRLLWAIGCNEVTRHDAVISVCAGFSGQELSALWPHKQNWRLTEQRAGMFSHLFIAQKIK
jgi:ubiquinone/menaquinone biosynthesis C-methylase UbiE